MLSNCVAGEDSEYSLEGVMLKLQYFGNLMQKANSLEKTLMLGKIGGRRRRGWQRMRWLDGITYGNGHELGQTLGDGEGQRGLVCCSPWGCKELGNWTATSRRSGKRGEISGCITEVGHPGGALKYFLWLDSQMGQFHVKEAKQLLSRLLGTWDQ